MYQIEITYTSGMELFDVKAKSSAEAIMESLRLSNLMDRRKGTYRTVVKVEIKQHTL